MTDKIYTLIKIIKHKEQVSFLLREIARQLEKRADIHDQSKLSFDEFDGFFKLDDARNHQKEEYGSKSYEDAIKNNNALHLHYERNPHHPEHYPNGIDDMNFVDIIEMLCDWKAAIVERDTKTDINKTWLTRQKRFNLSDFQILFLRTIWEGIFT